MGRGGYNRKRWKEKWEEQNVNGKKNDESLLNVLWFIVCLFLFPYLSLLLLFWKITESFQIRANIVKLKND